MKKALVIVTLQLLLTACAQLPSSAPKTAASSVTPMAVANPGPDAKVQAIVPAEKLPQVELTGEILYKILSAEIAFQRNDWQYAYVTLLGLAQQTRDPRLARRASEIALSSKRAGEALAAIRLWHELAPDSEQATQYYLGFVVLSGNLDEAQPIFATRLEQTQPKLRGVMMMQIQRTLASAKDKQAVLSMLDALFTPYLAQPEAHLALARAAFEAGDGTRATKEAQIATHAQPNSELAILTLAQVAPDKAAASIALTNFLDKHPKAREVRIAYARLLVEEKQYQSARAQFATLLKSDPHDLTTLFALGTLSAELDDYSGAEQYLSSYIDTLAAKPDPARDPTQALLMLAQIAQDRNDIPRALKWLGQVEPGPAYVGAQIKRAQLVARQGNIEHAQKMLTEISTDGEREETQVILARGQILRDAGRVQQAREVLQHALQKTPNNVDLLYDYAMLAEQQNDLDTMETALRKIIQIAPKNQHAYNALGYALADHNVRLPEALVLITQALQMAPQDPFILDSMGWVQYRMGQLQQAQDYLQRAYDAQPDTEIGVHLGEVLWVSGQHEAALKLWRTVRDKDPKSKVLESTLTRLQVAL